MNYLKNNLLNRKMLLALQFALFLATYQENLVAKPDLNILSRVIYHPLKKTDEKQFLLIKTLGP
jgi:hypothetical protein